MNRLAVYIFFVITLLPLNLYCAAITLKSGQVVNGNIITQDDESVTIDFEGVSLKYYRSDISSIDESAKPQEQPQPQLKPEEKPALAVEDVKEFDDGMKMLEGNRLWEAIAQFKKSFENDPRDSKSSYNIAGAYFMLGKFDDAIQWYKKTISIDVNSVNAYLGLGMSYRLSFQYPLAIEALTKALGIDEKNALAMTEMGAAYQAMEDWDNSIIWYKKALAIDVGNAQTYHFLGMAYGRLGEYKKAIEAFGSAVSIDPEYADAYFSMGATILAMLRNTGSEDAEATNGALKYFETARSIYARLGDEDGKKRVEELLQAVKGNKP